VREILYAAEPFSGSLGKNGVVGGGGGGVVVGGVEGVGGGGGGVGSMMREVQRCRYDMSSKVFVFEVCWTLLNL